MRNLIDIPIINIAKCEQLFYRDPNSSLIKYDDTGPESPGMQYIRTLNCFNKVNYISFAQRKLKNGESITCRKPINILEKIKNIKNTKGVDFTRWVLRHDAFKNTALDAICPNISCLVMRQTMILQNENLRNVFQNTSSWRQLNILTIWSKVSSEVVCQILKECNGLTFLDIENIRIYFLDNPNCKVNILTTIRMYCKKLKVLKLPETDYWAKQVKTCLMGSSMKLNILTGNVIDYDTTRPLCDTFAGKTILSNLTHLVSTPKIFYSYGKNTSLNQKWLLVNMSKKLIVFDCKWFVLTQTFIKMLSTCCPDLKYLYATCYDKDENLKGYFLREIGMRLPLLTELRLILFSKGLFNNDYVNMRTQLCLNDDDLIDTLGNFLHLKYLSLYDYIFNDEIITRIKIKSLGITFNNKNIDTTHSISHFDWFNTKN